MLICSGAEDSGAGTSSCWVKPSNTALRIYSICRGGALAEPINSPYVLQYSLWYSTESEYQISFITFWIFLRITSFYRGLSAILTSHFSNSADLWPQIPNASTKHYKLVPAHAEKPYNVMQNTGNRDILYLKNTFQHCKNSHYLWIRVYK